MWQLHKIFVTVQYLHTYRNLPRSFPSDAWQVTRKNPFQIGCADGIFAFKPMFSYGQRSKCADLLNSYFPSMIFFSLSIRMIVSSTVRTAHMIVLSPATHPTIS